MAPALDRITLARVGGRTTFLRNGQEVVLLGANYVVKAPPYFPTAAQIDKDAAAMAEGARLSAYTPSAAKVVLPCVRLGCLLEGAMPSPGGIDTVWAERLEVAVDAFARHGVYVFLDVHQDALCASTGGEGLPYWMAESLQRASPDEDLTISPSRPLALAFSGSWWPWEWPCVWHALTGVRPVATMPGDASPWLPFSSESAVPGEQPRDMHLGNASVRLNNSDAAWAEGRLLFTRQCVNMCRRFYRAPFTADADILFEPYVHFVRHLSSVWEAKPNVIAIDLLNEPPFM